MIRTFGEALADTLEDAEQVEELPLYVISEREAVELAGIVLGTRFGNGKEGEFD